MKKRGGKWRDYNHGQSCSNVHCRQARTELARGIHRHLADGFVIEAVLAFFLVTVVLSTAIAGRAGS
jgi:hypothetical protein